MATHYRFPSENSGVNGATVKEILTLLNKDYIKWIGLAFIVSSPLVWLIINTWLENFAYRASLSWWVFAVAEVSTLVIALLTVSWQSDQAAAANPATALKNE